MAFSIFYFFLFCILSPNQTYILNIANLVNPNLTKLSIYCQLFKDYDIIAVQEVVAGYGGVLLRLSDELNRTGSNGNYIISDPTSAYKTERYAFIWKTNKLKQIGKAWLEKIPFRN
jgi:hypothetical protein